MCEVPEKAMSCMSYNQDVEMHSDSSDFEGPLIIKEESRNRGNTIKKSLKKKFRKEIITGFDEDQENERCIGEGNWSNNNEIHEEQISIFIKKDSRRQFGNSDHNNYVQTIPSKLTIRKDIPNVFNGIGQNSKKIMIIDENQAEKEFSDQTFIPTCEYKTKTSKQCHIREKVISKPKGNNEEPIPSGYESDSHVPFDDGKITRNLATYTSPSSLQIYEAMCLDEHKLRDKYKSKMKKEARKHYHRYLAKKANAYACKIQQVPSSQHLYCLSTHQIRNYAPFYYKDLSDTSVDSIIEDIYKKSEYENQGRLIHSVATTSHICKKCLDKALSKNCTHPEKNKGKVSKNAQPRIETLRRKPAVRITNQCAQPTTPYDENFDDMIEAKFKKVFQDKNCNIQEHASTVSCNEDAKPPLAEDDESGKAQKQEKKEKKKSPNTSSGNQGPRTDRGCNPCNIVENASQLSQLASKDPYAVNCLKINRSVGSSSPTERATTGTSCPSASCPMNSPPPRDPRSSSPQRESRSSPQPQGPRSSPPPPCDHRSSSPPRDRRSSPPRGPCSCPPREPRSSPPRDPYSSQPPTCDPYSPPPHDLGYSPPRSQSPPSSSPPNHGGRQTQGIKLESQKKPGCQHPHEQLHQAFRQRYNGEVLCIHNPPCVLINGCLNVCPPTQPQQPQPKGKQKDSVGVYTAQSHVNTFVQADAKPSQTKKFQGLYEIYRKWKGSVHRPFGQQSTQAFSATVIDNDNISFRNSDDKECLDQSENIGRSRSQQQPPWSCKRDVATRNFVDVRHGISAKEASVQADPIYYVHVPVYCSHTDNKAFNLDEPMRDTSDQRHICSEILLRTNDYIKENASVQVSPKFSRKPEINYCVHVPLCKNEPQCFVNNLIKEKINRTTCHAPANVRYREEPETIPSEKLVSQSMGNMCEHIPQCPLVPQCRKCKLIPLCKRKYLSLTARRNFGTQVKPKMKMVCRHQPPCVLIPKCLLNSLDDPLPYEAMPQCVHKPMCDLIPACCRSTSKKMVTKSPTKPPQIFHTSSILSTSEKGPKFVVRKPYKKHYRLK